MSRDDLLRDFLDKTGWHDLRLALLAGDASNRRYLRGTRPDGRSLVIMDAPSEKGEDVRPFIDVTRRLRALGFSAPEILAADEAAGFLIIEDLGDDLYARIARPGPQERELYAAAVDLLVSLHQAPETATGLPCYDADFYLREVRLVPEWYLPGLGLTDPGPVAEFEMLAAKLFDGLMPKPPVCVLRDYHAENLIWLPERAGLARVGLLDYQGALAGNPAYDLVSLLEDARRDTAPELQQAMLLRYISASGADADAFRRAYAILGAQRNLKIMGLFARLAIRDGKPGYLAHMPRVWAHLQNDLSHPDLAALKAWVDRHIPSPDASVRARLAEQA